MDEVIFMKNTNLRDRESTMYNRIIPYNQKLAPLFIRDSLFSLIPDGTKHIYVVGVGSNQISGDSIGPFVGTLLKGLYPGHLTVLGNVQQPLDATTLGPRLLDIHFPSDSFVIAIDSVLGMERLVNSIIVKEGSLQPGIGVGNTLPLIGDCSLMGVVLKNDATKERSLLCTNLHTVYTMATSIAKGISLTVRQYFNYPSNHRILLLN